MLTVHDHEFFLNMDEEQKQTMREIEEEALLDAWYAMVKEDLKHPFGFEEETQHTRKYRCAYCGNRYSVRPDPEDGEYCSSCHEKWDPVEDVEDVEAEKEHNI